MSINLKNWDIELGLATTCGFQTHHTLKVIAMSMYELEEISVVLPLSPSTDQRTVVTQPKPNTTPRARKHSQRVIAVLTEATTETQTQMSVVCKAAHRMGELLRFPLGYPVGEFPTTKIHQSLAATHAYSYMLVIDVSAPVGYYAVHYCTRSLDLGGCSPTAIYALQRENMGCAR